MNRLTQILLSLAALMVLALGALVLVSFYGNPFHRVTNQVAPAATSGEPADAAEARLRLGTFAELAPDLARASLMVDAERVESYRYKEISGASVNQLYSGPQGDRWLFPTNGQLILSIDDISPEPQRVRASVIQLVPADTDGNGTLSPADGIRVVLTAPDGTAPVILAEGLSDRATLSGGTVWRVVWEKDGATYLAEIPDTTGTARPTRTLTMPASP